MRVTAARRAEHRASLLEAGLRLFRAQGFGATSVDQVAAAAGLAKGTFYNYFRTKEDLALAAFVAALGEAEARLPDVLRAPALEGRLDALLQPFGRWAVHPELVWVWALENLRRGQAEPASATLRRLISAVFADAQARGEIASDRAADHLALDVEGIVVAHVAAWYHGGAGGALEPALAEALAAYARGLRAAASRP